MPEIITIIGAVASLIGSVTVIAKLLKRWMFSAVSDQFKALEEKTDEQDKKIDAISDQLQRMTLSQERARADSARRNILAFNDELLRHVSHSMESFNQTIDDIDAYERYCRHDRDYENNKALLAIENIRRCYRLCQENSSFLA